MSESAVLANSDVISLFTKVRYGKYKGILTPHKQLLILFILAKYRCNCNRLIPYYEIDYALLKIAKQYFPEIRVFYPNYPFWRLQNDHIWEVTNKEKLSHQSTTLDINRREFLQHEVYGGFTNSIYQALLSDAALFYMLAKMVAENLPEDKQNSILSDMGLSTFVPNNINVYEENKSHDFYELFIQEDSDENIVIG